LNRLRGNIELLVQPDRLGFILFSIIVFIFYVIPDPEMIQKPFRIGLALLFAIIYLALLINQQIRIRTLVPIIISAFLVYLLFARGTIQSSFINVFFCLIGLLIFSTLTFKLSAKRLFDLQLLHFICMVSIIIQFLLFTSKDGRPSLGYELNLSGAYLFLFFLFSDILDRKDGKILVIGLSLFILSRLLIFSILLFYLIRLTKKFLPSSLKKLRFIWIAILGYILISIFSVWYVAYVKTGIVYDTSMNRLTTLNDGSNQWRFLTNSLVMARIYQAPADPDTLLGFGPIENFIKATKGSLVMPHNELFDAIVQFGLLSVVFFAFITLPIFNSYSSYSNLEYSIPLLFYTMILWVRFIIVPSFEMIFILFMLNIVNEKNKSPETCSKPYGYSFSAS
jgi:hypothetical protein